MTRTLVALIGALLVGASIVSAAPTATLAGATPPAGMTGAAFAGRVVLAWQPVSGAGAYTVYRGTSAGAITTQVTPAGGVTGTSFTDSSAQNGSTYYYAVRSVLSGAESTNSVVVSATPRAASCSTGNEVVLENCRPGDTGWQVTNYGGIDAFATATSINKGQSVDIKVNSSGGYHIDIYRSGYYGGAGARLFSTMRGLPASNQPVCNSDSSTGLVDCSNWAVSTTLTTTSSWPSGIYLLRLVRDDTGSDTMIVLAVRDDARSSDILYGLPIATYEAYNNWGGRSVYDWNSNGPPTVAGTSRAVKVSFDRPFNQFDGQWNFYPETDYPLVSWLEQNGYDVSYTTNVDLEASPQLVRNHRVYMLGGHDEYWSAGMRTALEQGRDAGISIFAPSANALYWKVRFETDPLTGVQRRVLVCYKSTQSGGPDPSGIPTGTWRDPAGANDPENAVLGAMYTGDNDEAGFPYVVTAQQGHDPVYRYTSLATASTSTSIGSTIVGWEWDKRFNNGFEPPGVTTLSSSPVSGNILTDAGKTYTTGSAVSNAVKYTASSGALVFDAGTDWWWRGLGSNSVGIGDEQPIIRQATTNILEDMGVAPLTPAPGIVLDAGQPPTVLTKAPADASTGVSVATTVRAGFSRVMDASTITPSSFTLTSSGGTVAASVAYDVATRVATLTPTSQLGLSTTYTARLAATIKASDGTPLANAVVWTFTTSSTLPSPPTVTAKVPSNGATGVSTNTSVQATFSRAVDPATINGSTFTLTAGSNSVPAAVSYDVPTRTATLVPTVALAYSTSYTATLTTQIAAADDGTPLAAPVTWTFTTAAPPAPPTVTSRSPVDGASGVGVQSGVSATFSRAMDPSTLTASSFTLAGPSGPVAASVSYDGPSNTATLVPSSSLAASTTYTARLDTSVKAADGTALGSVVTWAFTTSSTVCPCQLFSPLVTPASQNLPVQDGRTGPGPWSYEMGVKVQVTQQMELDSIRFYKSSSETGTHVGRVWSAAGAQLAQVTFTGETGSGWQQQALASPLILQPNVTYVVSVGFNAYFSVTGGGLATQATTGPLHSVADGANGVYGSAAGVFPTQSFNSGNYFVDLVAAIPTAGPPPTVTSRSPVDGASGVGVQSGVSATFSRAMDPSTLTASSFTLAGPSGPVAASVSYDGPSNTATLVPSSSLAASTTYTARLDTSVKAADGTALGSVVTWAFTTSSTVCPCQLFSPLVTPASQNLPVQDGRTGPGPWSYEMGVKVQVTQQMELDSIRFYKSSSETGTHVGRVWSAAGAQLAQVTFTGETGSGWQQQALASPLILQPNVTYVVSVGFNAYFSVTGGGLATQATTGPLHSVADGANGVYGSAAGVFPTQSFNSGNYFVDLVAAIPTAGPPPTVTSRSPVDGASGVGVQSGVSATFSRAMDPSTLTASSFTLAGPSGPVAASVSYDGPSNTATLTPSSALATSTTYTAQLSTAVTSQDGVPLAQAVSWTFTTDSKACPCRLFPSSLSPDLQNLPVQDGRPGPGPWSYEMGVKVQVTQQMELDSIRFYKSSSETGTHVGRVWSAAGAQLAQVTFTGETGSGWQQQALASPLILQPNVTYVVSVGFNASYSVTIGGLANQVTVGPLHSVADGANGVYADAAGNFPSNSNGSSNYFVDVGVADVPSPTVTGRSPVDGAPGVDVQSGVSATFSRAMDPSTLTASSFTLAGPSGPVAASVSYDGPSKTATLTPSSALATSTTYTAQLSTAVTSQDGVPLAQPVSWTFTTVAATPTVTARSPAAGATGVAVSSAVSATFSRAMDPSTITTSSFTLTGPSGATSASVSYDGPSNTATLTPSSPLANSTTYTAQLSTAVTAQNGSPLAQAVSWSFTTVAAAPTVTARSPSDGATAVAVSSAVSATFSRAMDPTTLTASSFTLMGPSGAITASVSYNAASNTATLTPSSALANSTLYAAQLSTAVAAQDGVPLAQAVSWSFTTVAAAPTVTARSPAAGATAVAVSAAVSATFSRAMDATTLTTSSFTLTGPSGAIPASVSYSSGTNTATLTPSSLLANSTVYTAQLSTAVTAQDGMPLAQPVSWSFTTVADTTPPGPPTSFAATVNSTSVSLLWQNPSDLDFDHTRIVRKLGSPPANSSDGVVVCNCTAPTTTDLLPAAGQSAFYAAYAFDKAGNASTPARAQADVPAPTDVYTSFVKDSSCTICSASVANGELTAIVASTAQKQDTAYGLRNFGGTTGFPGRVYVRDVVRLPAGQTIGGNTLWIFSVHDVTNQVVYEINLSSTGLIRFTSPAGGLRSTAISQSTGVTVPNDGVTKRRIEISALANSSVEVRVDGVTKISITGLSGATTGNQRYIRAGIDRWDGSSSTSARVYHSAVTLGQAGWLGP